MLYISAEDVVGGSQSVIVLCYRDVLPYPQCKLVTGRWSNALKQFKMQIIVCKDALKPEEFIKQRIDKNRKCISKLTKDGWVQCLWRPLDIERAKTDETSYSALVHAQRLRTYFIHDLYLMCKQWNVINIEIVDSNVFFIPKLMRKAFSTADEFTEYYSSRYPSLFSRGVLRVIQGTHDKLKRCYEDSMIFLLIVSSKEFIRRRKNMITIMHSSDNKQLNIGISN